MLEHSKLSYLILDQHHWSDHAGVHDGMGSVDTRMYRALGALVAPSVGLVSMTMVL